jgi:hypothetical protein
VVVYVCSFGPRGWINKFDPNLALLCHESKKRFEKGHNKVYWVRVPTNVVPVARKLGMTEERRQNKTFFISTRIIEDQILKPRKAAQGFEYR